MTKKKVAIFGRLHINNLYTGVDGCSTNRMLLADKFDLTMISPHDSLTTEEPRPDLDRFAKVLLEHEIDVQTFLIEATKDAGIWVDTAEKRDEGLWTVYGKNWRDCEALVVYYRSSQFSEFQAQVELLKQAKGLEMQIIVIDMDCWMLADYLVGLDVARGCTQWSMYPNAPEAWGYIRNPFSFGHHSHDRLPDIDHRPFDLTYIGNDYNRRVQMKCFFRAPKRCLAGNWDRNKEKLFEGTMMSSRDFMRKVLKVRDEEFMGATPHFFVHAHYLYSKASLYVQPSYYDFAGNTTLRFFESLDVGCVPLVAAESVRSPILHAYEERFPRFTIYEPSQVEKQFEDWHESWNEQVKEWAKEYDEEHEDDMIRRLQAQIS